MRSHIARVFHTRRATITRLETEVGLFVILSTYSSRSPSRLRRQNPCRINPLPQSDVAVAFGDQLSKLSYGIFRFSKTEQNGLPFLDLKDFNPKKLLP